MLKDVIQTTLDTIMGGFETPTSFEELQTYLSKNGWSISYSRGEVIKALDLVLKEELPDDPADNLLNLLLGQTKKARKLTKKQRSELKTFLSIAKAAKSQECDHDKMVIAAFAHGGGFSPPFAQGEVICLTCGLNVTLYNPRDLKQFKKELGINTTKAKMKKLSQWAQECMKNSRAEKRIVAWAEEITKDPIAAYNNAGWKWEEELPFTITNKKVFESNSGK